MARLFRKIIPFLLVCVLVCSSCYYENNNDNSEPPTHQHTFSDWAVESPATCTQEGVEIKSCLTCTYKEQRSIPKIDHTEEIDAKKEPTCEETGLTEGKHCSKCNKILLEQQEIDARGHKEVDDPERKYCLTCGKFLEDPLYSFGVISDVHVKNPERSADKTDTKANYIRALNYYKSKSANFVCVVGDTIWNGSDGVPELDESNRYWLEEVTLFSSINNDYFNDQEKGQKVYSTTGNHDASLRGYSHGAYGLNEKVTYYKDGTMSGEQVWEDIVGTPLNYAFEQGEDVFLFVGMYFWNYTSWYKNDDAENWLKVKLEENKDKRVFLFFHLYMNNTYDNLIGNMAYSGVPTGKTVGDASRFEKLANSYSNVVWFNGHSHINTELASNPNFSSPNVYQKEQSMTMVHVPACAFIRDLNQEQTNYERNYAKSQGLWIDVYQGKVVVKAIDFTSSEFIDNTTYIIK
ncbi:MAG: metallophosphoesterase [Clostridia bacterium]|nr:metallophosphoesterase [Clostridia bacterium]